MIIHGIQIEGSDIIHQIGCSDDDKIVALTSSVEKITSDIADLQKMLSDLNTAFENYKEDAESYDDHTTPMPTARPDVSSSDGSYDSSYDKGLDDVDDDPETQENNTTI